MYVVTGSVTSAERLKKAVERVTGFPAYVVHTPSPIRKGGCSYAVRIDERALGAVKKIAREYGISYKKIYRVTKRNGESVYHAVS